MNNSIGKNTLLITASKLSSLVINTVSVMLLSRIRTLDEYGTYSQLMMAVNLVSTLLILGLPNSINYFLARTEIPEERRTFLSHYYTLNALLCGFSGAMLVLCLPLLELYFHNSEISTYAFFLLLYPFASITMSSVESVLMVYERTRMLAAYRLLNSLTLLGIIIIADQYGLTFRQYMVLFIATELAFALVVYSLAWRLCGGLHPAFSMKKLKEIASFCIPIGLASAVGTLSAELDKLVISYFFSTEEYAIYTNAAKELPLTVLASATTMVIMPKVVQLLHRDQKEQAVSLWKDAFVFNYAIMAVLVFGIITYAPEVITILYSEKYLPGITVFRLYALLLLLRSTYFGMILNAKGKTKYIFHISILQLFVNLLLNIVCCKWIGFIGPAIATITTSLFGATLLCKRTEEELELSHFYIVPIIELGKITAINLIIAIAFASIKRLLHVEVLITSFLQSSLMGECAESLILGAVWIVCYTIIMKNYIKQKWDHLNVQGDKL